MFEFCITFIIGWVGSQKTTHLALRNFEIFPGAKTILSEKTSNQNLDALESRNLDACDILLG